MTTSIIIPVFNSEKYISRSIRSALSNKKYSDVEIVVINDCSTDHTLDSILPFMDKIIYLENDSNMGLPYANKKVLYLLLVSILLGLILMTGCMNDLSTYYLFHWI